MTHFWLYLFKIYLLSVEKADTKCFLHSSWWKREKMLDGLCPRGRDQSSIKSVAVGLWFKPSQGYSLWFWNNKSLTFSVFQPVQVFFVEAKINWENQQNGFCVPSIHALSLKCKTSLLVKYGLSILGSIRKGKRRKPSTWRKIHVRHPSMESFLKLT